MRNWLRLGEISVVMALAAILFISWREDRRDRSRLAAQLAAAQQSLNEASARQHDRDAQLNQSLVDLATLKRSVVTPAEILRALPQQIPLPAPITLQDDYTSSQNSARKPATEDGTPAANAARTPSSTQTPRQQDSPASAAQPVGATLGSPAGNTTNVPPGGASPAPTRGSSGASGNAVIPREDLKPLYDFALDCKACQAKLAAAQSDLQDEKTKTATLTKERDAAVRAAKGGSTWRRAARAAKWFLIGAAAGIVATKAHH